MESIKGLIHERDAISSAVFTTASVGTERLKGPTRVSLTFKVRGKDGFRDRANRSSDGRACPKQQPRRENRLDVNQQRRVADPAARLKGTSVSRLTRAILMKAAGADVQRATLRRHRPDFAMSLDKGVSHSDSLAKYAAAFFRMSRSVRVLANSAFRRAISICSALTVLPATSRNRPAASAFTQLWGAARLGETAGCGNLNRNRRYESDQGREG